MKISSATRMVGYAIIAGFIATTIMAQFAISRLKVNGPIYERIISGKDLVADILPPPEYLIESYLEVTLAAKAPATADERIANLVKLRKDYDERHVYWEKQDIDATVRDALTKRAHAPAMKFWEAVDGALIPALKSRDIAGIETAFKAITSAYTEHRARIDEVVQAANKMSGEIETSATFQERVILGLIWLVSLAMLGAIAASVYGLSRFVVTPVNEMTSATEALASGNLDVAVPHATRTDEIGQMAKAVAYFKEQLLAKREADAKAAIEARAKSERAERMFEITRSFERMVGGVIDSVTAASQQLSSTAEQLTDTARSASGQATSVAAASEQASSNVRTVAAASEQLSASVREINQRVHEASRISHEASDRAGTMSARVQALDEAAQRIGGVVELISSIASQTNLLALNATIEAARAGEAGKGFAVVASEVKSLADQTAKATAEISTQINAMQGATQEATSFIHDVARTITEIDGISTSIAASIQEQGTATDEIARNVAHASEGTDEITRNISDVRKSVEISTSGAGKVLYSARDLAQQAQTLRVEIDRFLSSVRAA